MSSTNRSQARETHIADYYVTPPDKIKEFLDVFIDIEGNIFNGANILDPCAGGDKTHGMSYPKALRDLNIDNVDTIDIRADSLAEIKADYLEIDCKNKYDVIITNPPFNISLDIIKKALDDVRKNGYVIMLLRLNYFGSKARKSFWDSIMPKYAFVHNRRISFLDNKKTDSIEYMHLVFQKGYKNKFTKLFIV